MVGLVHLQLVVVVGLTQEGGKSFLGRLLRWPAEVNYTPHICAGYV